MITTHSIAFTDQQVRQEVAQLPAYGAGQTLTQADMLYPSKNMVNLSVNENPFGASTAALNLVQSKLSDMSYYPDSQCTELKSTLSAKLNVPSEHLVIGNGSEDILSMLCKAFINQADAVFVAKPAFALHPIYANMMGANVSSILMDEHMDYDTTAWINAIKAHPNLTMLMIANPSNPVGCTLDDAGLQNIIDACPKDTFILIDEAYCEFANNSHKFADSLAILKKQNRPFAILRTFSKAYGLAGLRVGYGIMSDTHIVDYLDRVRTPYNVNNLAQAAAIAVLEDNSYLNDTVDLVNNERERVRSEVESFGYFVAPSLANFLFINVRQPATHVADIFLENGIMIKPWKEPGFEQFIRITIGLPEHNDRVIELLSQLVSQET
ncbi:histidinol-phosphate transaminase [Pseudoalteromonas aurantia]|uniref:Histidinol-phosphate aminotransferase n=1 Tax=Pseudoalteromonas aurantia 208 TaxID=1314867 RepID=A0ABR9ECI2_9GAMM|nr:histidinol-phosphate transaminase [Pseudoalteromonas aurantia]MBE0368701.1 histidinol-phosphate aminotransferase [Pseudoalteromonas aurantia 208]